MKAKITLRVVPEGPRPTTEELQADWSRMADAPYERDRPGITNITTHRDGIDGFIEFEALVTTSAWLVAADSILLAFNSASSKVARPYQVERLTIERREGEK